MKKIFLLLMISLVGCQVPSPEPTKPEVTLDKVKADIAELKAKLAPEGKYACCVDESCNYCLLHEGECDCAKDLQKGKHVCVECYAGWQQGKGNIPKIKKEQVKTDFVEHKH